MAFALEAQTVLVVQEGRGKVVVFSAAEPSRRTEITVGEKPHEIELTPDGRTAYVSNFGLLEANYKVGTPGTTISVLDVERRAERGRFHLPEGYTAPHGLKLRPSTFRELFTNAEEGRRGMVVLDAQSGKVVRTFALPAGVHNFVFNENGSALFAFAMKSDICRIDPDTGRVVAQINSGSPRGLAWTAGPRSQLLVSGKNEILVIDPEKLSIERRLTGMGVGHIFYPAATFDGHWILAPAVVDGVILVIDAVTGLVAHRIETGSPLLVAMASRSKQAWISNVLVPAGMFGPDTKGREGGIVMLDLTTFEVRTIAGAPDANGLAIVWETR